MPTAPPQLGYGQRGEAPINSVNQWMRAQPWYQQLITSFGQNPNNVHLNDTQKTQVIRAAQANGVVVDEGHDGQEVDDSGNFTAKGHGLRNTLIVAGIAGAALLTAGVAGAFAPAAAAGTAGASSAGAGGALASTAIGSGLALPIAGGTGLAAGAGAGAGTLGGLAGVGHFLSSPGGSTLASSLAGTFANIYGASKQADANKYSADLQDAATQRAEAFSRQQAEGAYQSNEHTQKANYDQWAAKQRAISSSLGQQLGINYQIPDYVPGIDPRYTGDAAPAPSSQSAAGPASAPATGGSSADALNAFYKSIGVTPGARGSGGTDIAYYTDELNAHGGPNAANLGYFTDRIKQDLSKSAGGASPAARPTLATFVSPRFLPYQTGTPLPTPYQPGTLGAYLGRG